MKKDEEEQRVADLDNKTCSICLTVKPLSEFHRNKNYADGHDSRCRDCKQELMKRCRAKKKKAIYNKNYREMRKKLITVEDVKKEFVRTKRQITRAETNGRLIEFATAIDVEFTEALANAVEDQMMRFGLRTVLMQSIVKAMAAFRGVTHEDN